jgi:hypothetical protein
MDSRLGTGARAYRYGQSSSINIQHDGTGSLLNGVIQLNDRQLKILEARRANKGHGLQQQQQQTNKFSQGQQHSLPLDSKKNKIILSTERSKLVDSPDLALSGTTEEYWAQEPSSTVETVPTTWSESSAAGSTTSSGDDSLGRAALQFYGQRLTGKDKKLYDDSGATWNDSGSQVSASTGAMSKASSGAPSDAGSSKISATTSRVSSGALPEAGSSKTSATISKVSSGAPSEARSSKVSVPRSRISHKSMASNSPRKQQQLQIEHEGDAIYQNPIDKNVTSMEAESARTTKSASIAGSSMYEYTASVIRQDSVKFRSQSKDESQVPIQSRSKSLSNTESNHPTSFSPVSPHREPKTPQFKSRPPRHQNSFKHREKSFVEAGASLVRNLLKSAPTADLKGRKDSVSDSSKTSFTKEEYEEAKSDASSKSIERGPTMRHSLMKGFRSPRSTSSGSSISQEEKMIMKRFAKRASKNPRRENLAKSESSRMKKMFTSKPSDSFPSPKPTLTDEENEQDYSKQPEDIAVIHSQLAREIKSQDTFDPNMLPLSPVKNKTSGYRRGRRSSVRMKMVTSQVMNDLIEENVIPESDEEDDPDDDQPSIRKARSIKSLPDIVKDDEIEVKISRSSEDESDASAHAVEGHTPLGWTPQPNDKAGNVAHATMRALEQINDDEPDGYNDFVSRLKSELAESHSKLFDKFHAMFREDNSRTKPLSMYPSALDLKTKETINNMSLYARGIPGVDCVTGSQVMSDKDVKLLKPGKLQYGQHLLHPNNANTVLTHLQHVQPLDTPKDSDESLQKLKVDGVGTASQEVAYEVTLSQHRRKSVAPSPTSFSVASGTLDNDSGLTENRTKDSSDSVAASNDSLFDEAQTYYAKRPSIPSKSISPKMFAPKAEKETIPWNSVKLRSVSEKSREVCDEENIPTTWAKVNLRPVQKADVRENSVDTSADSVESEEFHRLVLKKTPISACTPQNNFALTLAPSASTDMSGTENKPVDIDRNGDAQHPINLIESRGTGNKPIKVEDKIGTEWNPIEVAKEGSVMVSLAAEDSSPGIEMKLLLNKKGLMKVEAIPGEPKAIVSWRLDREEVKSALMNMSALSVKLIVSSGDQHHKDLRFASSEQCKKFANALHDLMHGSSGDSDNVKPDGFVSKSESSVYLEQLSADEQKVLEEFRQRKKNRSNHNKDFANGFLKISAETMKNKLPSVVNASCVGPSSPLSEVSGTTSFLSLNQTNTAETYKKMLQMKVPIEAVQHKMLKDQVDPKIIESVIGKELDSASPSVNDHQLSLEEDRIADTYRKMLKMGVPAEGVRHKMQKDGIDPKVMASVCGDGMPKPTQRASVPALSIVEEAVAETYRKMLKMMIPKEAVQHRMIKDGVDPRIMAIVIGKPPETQKVIDVTTGKLNDAENSIASVYRKMLKLNIPRDAVRHKMTQEGISKKIMVAVLGGNTSTDTLGQMIPQKRGFKSGFHWNPIADDESIAGSVWSKAKPMSDVGTKKQEAVIDISKHVEMFQKQPDAVVGKRKPVKSSSDTKGMAKLIDLNRANNVAITLKAFSEYSHAELAQIIEFLDPQGKIKGDRALFMKDLLPVATEVKAIKSYVGGDERLVTAEKWFKHITHIKRIEEKIFVMRTMETFKIDAIVLGKSFQLLTKVCNQVMDSDRLPDLLDMVRQIGNTMNEGRGEAAAGFKLDFLPRLAQTKGSDKKTTALDLVVMLFHVRNQRDALMLSAEIPECQEASRIQLSDLLTDVQTLEGSLRKCKKELDHLMKELESAQSGKPPPQRGPIPTDTRSDTALEAAPTGSFPRGCDDDAKTEVYGSAGSRFTIANSNFIESVMKVGQDGTLDKSSKLEKYPLSPRASLIATLQEKGAMELEFSLDASIRRLEKFVTESTYVILPKLVVEQTQAVEACKDLSSFFCESGREKAASNLLKILDEFASGIDRAVMKYDQQQKIEARKKATQKRKSLTSSKPPAPEILTSATQHSIPTEKKRPLPDAISRISAEDGGGEGENKSLVLMVNEMLRMAGDRQLRDFVEGVVYDNPDDRLKMIYEAENARKQDPFAARREMMSAITTKKPLRESNVSQKPSSALPEIRSIEASIGASRLTQSARQETTNDTLSEMPVSSDRRRRKNHIADRWSRMVEGDSIVEEGSENNNPVGKIDSEIVSSRSEEIEDKKYRRKKRQSYMERWASRTPVSEASTLDLDGESDVGAFEAMVNKQRQKAINRWSRKSADEILE